MKEKGRRSREVVGWLCVVFAVVLLLVLASATLVEKHIGTARTSDVIYSSLWFFLLWFAFGVCAAVYIWQRRLFKRPLVFLLHFAFAVILLGAAVTHFWGRQGSIHLREGEAGSSEYVLNEKGDVMNLPFKISLSDFEVVRYIGSNAPMDYVGKLEIEEQGKTSSAETAMNKVLRHKSYRFYPSSYDSDEKGVTLIVSYDPLGRFLTYTGYFLLLCGMVGFFFDKKSYFKVALKKSFVSFLLVLTGIGGMSQSAFAAENSTPKTVSKETASEFGKLNVSFGDRICPLSSLARDFTVKIYGKPSYRGLSCEQVLLGWYFFYDDWKNEPMIRVKTSEVKELLQTSGASYTSMRKVELYGGTERLRGKLSSRKALSDAERFSVVELLCGGGMLKIFPYSTSEGKIVWASQIDRLPQNVPLEQQFFVRNALNYIHELVVKGDDATLKETILKIKEYQQKEGGESIPSVFRFRAERLYDHLRISLQFGIVLFMAGLAMYLYACFKQLTPHTLNAGKKKTVVDGCCDVFLWIAAVLLLFIVVLCGFVSGHLPLSNGYETMQFMALCALVLTLFLRCKVPMIRPFGCIAAGVAMMVSMMGEHNPQLTPLRPVLSSPLLSVHVMTIMISYTVFFFLLLNGITGLILYLNGKKEESERFANAGTVLLYPAVFLLAGGIFIGAVWADRSWGSYWSWDPKEVWALITLLVYAAALHGTSLPVLRKSKNFHIFCIVSFLAVLITYFGVNFFLGGMHSYA